MNHRRKKVYFRTIFIDLFLMVFIREFYNVYLITGSLESQLIGLLVYSSVGGRELLVCVFPQCSNVDVLHDPNILLSFHKYAQWFPTLNQFHISRYH